MLKMGVMVVAAYPEGFTPVLQEKRIYQGWHTILHEVVTELVLSKFGDAIIKNLKF